jgi:hypothetical protein
MFAIIILLQGSFVFSQQNHSIFLSTIDTMVEKGTKQDVVKIRLKFYRTENSPDSILVKGLNRIIDPNYFIMYSEPFDSETNCKTSSLLFRIETAEGKIIEPNQGQIFSTKLDYSKKKIKYYVLDTINLCYKKTRKPVNIFPENDDIYIKKDTLLSFFPNINHFYPLKKGKYYLVVYYCNQYDTNEPWGNNQSFLFRRNDMFFGSFSTSKITLIIK